MSTGFVQVLARISRFFFCVGSALAWCRRGRREVLLSTGAASLPGIYRSNVGTSSSHDAGTANAPTAAGSYSRCASAADLCIGDQPHYGQGERSDNATTNKIG